MSEKDPELSVIIPALNEEKYIKSVFEGLRKQTCRNFETIVVDGGSTDSTREIALKHAKVLLFRKKGAGSARNFGARRAKGRVLLFLDADTRPSEGLVSTYIEAMKNGDIAGATGPILPLEKSVPLRIRLGYGFVSKFFVRATLLIGRPTFVGSNFAVRRSAFRKVRGFDESMMTYEDWDLSNRLRGEGRMVYLRDAVVHTSIRRVRQWGVIGYFIFYVENIVRYHLSRPTKSVYKPIR